MEFWGAVIKIRLPMQETQEMRVRPLGWDNPLEKEMAPHSRVPAWRLPWTEEPGGLQSTGPQGGWRDWAADTLMAFSQSFVSLAEFIRLPSSPLSPQSCSSSRACPWVSRGWARRHGGTAVPCLSESRCLRLFMALISPFPTALSPSEKRRGT